MDHDLDRLLTLLDTAYVELRTSAVSVESLKTVALAFEFIRFMLERYPATVDAVLGAMSGSYERRF